MKLWLTRNEILSQVALFGLVLIISVLFLFGHWDTKFEEPEQFLQGQSQHDWEYNGNCSECQIPNVTQLCDSYEAKCIVELNRPTNYLICEFEGDNFMECKISPKGDD